MYTDITRNRTSAALQLCQGSEATSARASVPRRDRTGNGTLEHGEVIEAVLTAIATSLTPTTRLPSSDSAVRLLVSVSHSLTVKPNRCLAEKRTPESPDAAAYETRQGKESPPGSRETSGLNAVAVHQVRTDRGDALRQVLHELHVRGGHQIELTHDAPLCQNRAQPSNGLCSHSPAPISVDCSPATTTRDQLDEAGWGWVAM